MTLKVLIMGLSGSGKTTLAEKIIPELKNKNLSVDWLNADVLREKYNDWDFTITGRLRQAERCNDLSNESKCDVIICDFIAPLPESRNIFKADYIIWLNTINKCKYDDTTNLFVKPKKYNYEITDYTDTKHVTEITNNISNLIQNID